MPVIEALVCSSTFDPILSLLVVGFLICCTTFTRSYQGGVALIQVLARRLDDGGSVVKIVFGGNELLLNGMRLESETRAGSVFVRVNDCLARVR
jgi:hypothetical protein